MTLRTHIPAFYWYSFTVVDPLICLSAIYMIFFSPSTFMDPGFASTSKYGVITPSHQFLLNQMSGAFAAWGFMDLFMLRQTNEMNVWTRHQQAVSLTDVAVMYAQYKALEAQGRLDLAKMRWEETSNVAIMVVILAVRLAFLSGLGFKKGQSAKKRV